MQQQFQCYHNYLMEKYKWNTEIIPLIDWPSHSAILMKYRDRRVTVVKHLFDISPTGKIAHRNDNTLAHQCPACNHPYEDNTHVLRCNAPSRQLWRHATLESIAKYDTPDNDPILMDIFQDGIRRYFMSLCPPDVHHYPTRYHRLLEEQAAIGWDQLFKARWSRQWNQVQGEYQQRHHPTTALLSSNRWTTAMGRRLLDRWLALWDIRNEERHGRDAEQKQAAKLQHITAQLEDIYSYKSRVCPNDVHLFYSNVEEHLQRHTSICQIEDWLSMHSEAIRASAALARKLGLSRNRTITDYPTFNPAIQPG